MDLSYLFTYINQQIQQFPATLSINQSSIYQLMNIIMIPYFSFSVILLAACSLH